MIVTKNLYKRIKVNGKWLKVDYAHKYSDGSMVYETDGGSIPDEMVEGYSSDETTLNDLASELSELLIEAVGETLGEEKTSDAAKPMKIEKFDCSFPNYTRRGSKEEEKQ